MRKRLPDKKKFLPIPILAAALLILLTALSASALEMDCTTREEVVAAIRSGSVSRPEQIVFSYSASLAPHIADKDWMTAVLYDAGIDQASWSYTPSRAGSCTLTNISYMEAIPCASEEELVSLLRNPQNGKLSVRLSQELFLRLRDNDWASLYDLLGQAGITGGNFSYYDAPKCVVEFQELTLAQNFYSITTPEQFRQHMQSCAMMGETSVAFYCTDELYQLLYRGTGAAGTHFSQEVAENCGITHSNFLFNEQKHLVFSDNLQYYPGARIIALLRTDQAHLMSPEEKRLLEHAMNMANNARSRCWDEAGLVLAICEDISQGCQYLLCDDPQCPGCERDGAYGALLHGYANCDGYADAFYLVATLAGLDAGYQHGDSVDNTTGAAHIWNTVTLDGQIFFVDLTWADSDGQGLYPYWLNMGADIASLTHQWNPDAASRSVAARTDPGCFWYYRNGCAFSSPDEGRDYLLREHDAGQNVVQLMFAHSGNPEEAVSTLLSGFPYGGSYSHRVIGGAIFFTFRFD